MNRIVILRIIHGLFALYFLFCLAYLYYASIFSQINIILLIAVISLGLEGFVVFILNKGDCPLIHIQRRIGDNTPFFNLILPAKLAKQAVPILTKLALAGFMILIMRLLFSSFR